MLCWHITHFSFSHTLTRNKRWSTSTYYDKRSERTWKHCFCLNRKQQNTQKAFYASKLDAKWRNTKIIGTEVRNHPDLKLWRFLHEMIQCCGRVDEGSVIWRDEAKQLGGSGFESLTMSKVGFTTVSTLWFSHLNFPFKSHPPEVVIYEPYELLPHLLLLSIIKQVSWIHVYHGYKEILECTMPWYKCIFNTGIVSKTE